MNQLIDLTPYLPQQLTAAQGGRRRRHFGSLAAAVETVVTLCIGCGCLLVLAAMLTAALRG